MGYYPRAAMERTMKIQEVILRALAKRITWWQVAEIMGITDPDQVGALASALRALWLRRLFDRRRGQPSPRRVPLKVAEQVRRLYQEK